MIFQGGGGGGVGHNPTVPPPYGSAHGTHLIHFLKTNSILTLKAPRKKMHLKMSSAEVLCCKELPNITDELSIEANRVDPEQTL